MVDDDRVLVDVEMRWDGQFDSMGHGMAGATLGSFSTGVATRKIPS